MSSPCSLSPSPSCPSSRPITSRAIRTRSPAPANREDREMDASIDVSMDVGLLIDGSTVRGQGAGESIVNPATGRPVTKVPSASKGQVEQAVKAAEKAFESWSETTPQQRSLL